MTREPCNCGDPECPRCFPFAALERKRRERDELPDVEYDRAEQRRIDREWMDAIEEKLK